MPAVVKTKAAPGLELQEVPVPEVGPNEVRIRVKKASICGTDVHIYNWDAWAQKTVPVPLVIGHEFVGVVDQVGSSVVDFKEGEIVTTEGHIVCGHCRNCLAGRRHLCPNTIGIGVQRPGGFAEYIGMPATNLWPIPDQIPSELAAFFDPYGNATHCALEFDVVGEEAVHGFFFGVGHFVGHEAFDERAIAIGIHGCVEAHVAGVEGGERLHDIDRQTRYLGEFFW